MGVLRKKMIEESTLDDELLGLLKEGLLEGEEFNYRDKELLSLLVRSVSFQQNYFWFKLEMGYPSFISDVQNGTFNGLSEEEWEELRTYSIDEIRKESNPQKRLDYFRKCALKLEEAEYLIEVIRKVKKEYKALLSIDISNNMFKSGKYTVSDIKEIMPWLSLSDIYGCSKMLSYDIALSEEEYEVIKKEVQKSGEPKVLREMFS